MAFPNTVKLRLYNEALRLMGEKRLASLTEHRDTRITLDGVWEMDPIRYVLEKALWKFARLTRELEDVDYIDPVPGFDYSFEKPEDLVRIAEVCSEESFSTPLLDYRDEGPYWYANIDKIYISYVSDDGDYGRNTNNWPKTFEKAVAAYMATQAHKRITQEDVRSARKVENYYESLLKEAKATDAQGGPTQFLPPGRWVLARGHGYRSNRDDRGTGGPF